MPQELPDDLIIDKLAQKYAFNKVLLNSEGKVVDFVFLRMNNAFEKMTGMKKELALGKRFTEVFPKSNKDEFDWVEFFGSVALNGAAQETTRYIEALKSNCRISAFSPERGYFITILEETESDDKKNSGGGDILNCILTPLFEKSPDIKRHALTVTSYSLAIARRLNFSVRQTNRLYVFALFHDIGKIGVHPEILHKSEPLTEEEWEIMTRHSEIGFNIAKSTPELSFVARYILSHHERWDGKGYPNGISGKKIPLLCRILSVADSYDAMINTRAYKKALSKKKAIAEIKRNAGTQFDPEIVRLFVEIL